MIMIKNEAEKPFKNICPNCGKDNLDFDAMEPEGQSLKQAVSCNDCGYGFTIWADISEWTYYQEEK